MHTGNDPRFRRLVVSRCDLHPTEREEHMNRAVFFDRDGVINELIWRSAEGIFDSPYDTDEVKLCEGAAEAITTVQSRGFIPVVISNQPGVAKGKSSLDAIRAVTSKIIDDLAGHGAFLGRIYYCIHHPLAIVPHLRVDCDNRKPNPGLILSAAAELSIDLSQSYLIGDSEKDIVSAHRAGVKSILLNHCNHSRITLATWTENLLVDAVSRIGWDAADFMMQMDTKHEDLIRWDFETSEQ